MSRKLALVSGVVACAISFAHPAQSAVPFTKVLDVPGTLSVRGFEAGMFTFGVSSEVVDHDFDGQTLVIEAIEITATGDASDPNVNFDWYVWLDNAPLGLTPGGSQMAASFGAANAASTPADSSTGWQFIVGDTNVAAPTMFALSGAYDFVANNGSASPAFGGTKVASTIPTSVFNGLFLQVAAATGDIDPDDVDFTMTNIQVTISGTIDGATAPLLDRMGFVALVTLLACVAAARLRRDYESRG